MTLWSALPPAELRDAARELVQPKDPGRHWTQIAAALGTCEDRSYYREFGFTSLRAWAEAELDLAPAETTEYLRFWRMIQASHLALEDWAQVGRGKARVIARAIGLGASPREWIDKALSAESEADLREALRRQAGKETWVNFHCAIPLSMESLIDEALRKALPEALEGSMIPQDPAAQVDLAYQRSVTFRCLEVILREYLQ